MSRVPRLSAELVIQRDGKCVRCGAHGGNVHHRKMRSQSSKKTVHNIENLIILCGSGTTGCHGWVHGNPRLSYERGWLVRSWQDPLEVPVFYAPEGAFFMLNHRGTRVRKDNHGFANS